MKYSGYRKSIMSGNDENPATVAYDTGYDQGQKDLFVPMAGVGIVCGILGVILASI